MRGEVTVEPLTWDPERFAALTDVWLEREDDLPRHLCLERWRSVARGLVVKVAGVDSPEAARQELVGGYLTIPRERVAPLPDDRYYVFEVVGCDVFDEGGTVVGQVSEVLEMPASDVYVVRLTGGGEVLVPAVRDFVRAVETSARRVVVRRVEDLLDAER